MGCVLTAMSLQALPFGFHWVHGIPDEEWVFKTSLEPSPASCRNHSNCRWLMLLPYAAGSAITSACRLPATAECALLR